VVAVHGDDFTAGFICMSSESLEEVENLNLIAASIEHVAHLNHASGSVDPVFEAVNQPQWWIRRSSFRSRQSGWQDETPPQRFNSHLFSSLAFALRLPWLSPLTARLFSTFQVTMEDAPNASMDAIQRCLMFEDRDETTKQGRVVAEWVRISPGAAGL
jgi:hypothetical protein